MPAAFPVPRPVARGPTGPWNMKRVRGASELPCTDWAFPWATENADARGGPVADPALEVARAPAGRPETDGDLDPAPCLAAGARAGAGATCAEGSGVGLAASGGARLTPAGSRGLNRCLT